MDGEYDAIVLGTGLKECLISGLLSVHGKKVLHMDRNNYYGGESASFNLNQLWETFRPGQKVPENLGANRDWSVDLIPKFIMANGKLVHTLLHTGVTRYMEFKAVEGSYVAKEGKVKKVPATDMEALKSDLIGFFEKRRLRSFFLYIQAYDESNPTTHKGQNLYVMTMDALYKYFSLDPSTIEFIGHCLALHHDEGYMRRPALPTVKRIQLYYQSLTRFEGLKSPYIYPMYGLGELPQGFARLAAVHGGTYMLNKPDLEVLYSDSGAFEGVKDAEGAVARAPLVVGDASYFVDKTRIVSRVVRAICIMDHPIPDTSDSHSVQIIIPHTQVGRKNDIYVFCSSYSHNIAAAGKYVAFVSTTVETSDPEGELKAGLALLGPVLEKFVITSEVHEPLSDGKADQCYISTGYDATSHFETTVEDVLALYTRITGDVLDVTGPIEGLEEQQS